MGKPVFLWVDVSIIVFSPHHDGLVIW